jgi:hypothetical protein
MMVHTACPTGIKKTIKSFFMQSRDSAVFITVLKISVPETAKPQYKNKHAVLHYSYFIRDNEYICKFTGSKASCMYRN